MEAFDRSTQLIQACPGQFLWKLLPHKIDKPVVKCANGVVIENVHRLSADREHPAPPINPDLSTVARRGRAPGQMKSACNARVDCATSLRSARDLCKACARPVVANVNPVDRTRARTHCAAMILPPPPIYVDADACPVKPEIYRVAGRAGCKVWLVANQPLRLPTDCVAELVVVGSGFDAADDWIAERAAPATIVVTADIPLADRCVKAGAVVIGPTGRPFTPDSIGSALAGRALMADLRDMGVVSGGPPPLSPRDRSAFLQSLDQAVQALKAGRTPRWR